MGYLGSQWVLSWGGGGVTGIWRRGWGFNVDLVGRWGIRGIGESAGYIVGEVRNRQGVRRGNSGSQQGLWDEGVCRIPYREDVRLKVSGLIILYIGLNIVHMSDSTPYTVVSNRGIYFLVNN